MIKSFADKIAESIWNGDYVKKLSTELQIAVRKKLRYLDAAEKLEELVVPPGNCLEALRGDRKGQHSIRVNKQWRICFVWKDGNAYEVEVVDYH